MKNQIIVAMDMKISEGIDLIQEIEKYPEIQKMIYGYKIGSLWILDKGINILEEVGYELTKHIGCRLILDMQKWGTDIPDIIKKQVEKVAPCVDELICCPMGAGSESLKMFAKTCIENNIKQICVLEMTHPEANKYLMRESYLEILMDAVNCGFTSFVIPATKEPKQEIKDALYELFKANKWFEKKFVDFYATGFKVQGGQVKPMVDFGVTKFIVGRAIYEAEPIKAIENIYKEINEV